VFGITFEPVDRYSNSYSASKDRGRDARRVESVPCCGSRLVMSFDGRAAPCACPRRHWRPSGPSGMRRRRAPWRERGDRRAAWQRPV
jgi:hypothetical protein